MYSRWILTLKELEAEIRWGSQSGVVDRFLVQVIRGVHIPPKLHKQLNQICVFCLGCVMKSCLVELGSIHVCPFQKGKQTSKREESAADAQGCVFNRNSKHHNHFIKQEIYLTPNITVKKYIIYIYPGNGCRSFSVSPLLSMLFADLFSLNVL